MLSARWGGGVCVDKCSWAEPCQSHSTDGNNAKYTWGPRGLGHGWSEAAAASLRPRPPGGARAPRQAPARHGGAERLRPPRWRGLGAPLARAARSRFRRAARSSSVGNKNHLGCWWMVGKWARRLAGNQVPPPGLFVVFCRVILGLLLGCPAGG